MTLETRLDKAQARLTPKQAVLLWLDEAIRQYPSLISFRMSDANLRSEHHWMDLVTTAKACVRANMQGQSASAILAGQNAAVMEVCFLAELMEKCNDAIHAKAPVCELEAVACARAVQLLILTETTASGPGQGPAARQHPAADTIARIVAARHELCRHATRLYLYDTVIKLISTKYFNGHRILFDDAADDLAKGLIRATQLVDEFNAVAGRWVEQSPGLVIDRQSVHAAVAAMADREIAWLVRPAKISALVMTGQRPRARELFLRLFSSSRPAVEAAVEA